MPLLKIKLAVNCYFSWILCILLVALLFIYNTNNFLYNLDLKLFIWMNSLLTNTVLAKIVAWLSHKHESWINVLVMLGINFYAWLMLKRDNIEQMRLARSKTLNLVLYCWFSFQLILLLNNLIFQKILAIHRHSPSIVAPTCIRLSQIFNNPAIRDYSDNSFPAGHALVLTYWALFVNLYATKLIKLLAWTVGIVLIVPRMITGAHWISDTIFTIGLAWIYFELGMWVANNYVQVKKRLS